ncbi:MAG: hypothetical protein JOY62_09210 [Acidobacteriaceae bacterium]|nr:hypothetical protein [Acidobacteriaceae bacterium]MBV9780137.1 hypothetical protein [Acidobacteriaceae bacterium]
MRRELHFALCAVVLFLTAVRARADLKTVTKLTFGGYESTLTQYVQGSNSRLEVPRDFGASRHAIATIYSAESKSQYVVDLETKEYVKNSGFDPLLALAMWIRRPPRGRESGKTVDVYVDTIDTGERREIFGYTARHILSRERRVAGAGACSGNSELDEDGWYISLRSELPKYRTALRAYAGRVGQRTSPMLVVDLAGGGAPCTDKIVMHGTKVNEGFPVLLRTSNARAGSRPDAWITSREVTELSEEPLDKNLFAPPKDFKRVESLPANPSMSWTERLNFEWRQVEEAFESWFE